MPTIVVGSLMPSTNKIDKELEVGDVVKGYVVETVLLAVLSVFRRRLQESYDNESF